MKYKVDVIGVEKVCTRYTYEIEADSREAVEDKLQAIWDTGETLSVNFVPVEEELLQPLADDYTEVLESVVADAVRD